MSFSEYNGSKTKVSTAVGRILRNAHENLPKIQNAQGSALSRLLRSISSSSNSVSERMSTQGSHSSLSSSHSSQCASTWSKFGFQKLRLGSGEKKRGSNQHAELLDDQQDQEDSEGEQDDRDANGHFMPLSKSSLIDPRALSSPTTHKQKKWRF